MAGGAWRPYPHRQPAARTPNRCSSRHVRAPHGHPAAVSQAHFPAWSLLPPEPCRALFDLLERFQHGRCHLALVTKEDAIATKCLAEGRSDAAGWQGTGRKWMDPRVKFMGIVTIEDVLEEIIGEEIEDEADRQRAATAAAVEAPATSPLELDEANPILAAAIAASACSATASPVVGSRSLGSLTPATEELPPEAQGMAVKAVRQWERRARRRAEAEAEGFHGRQQAPSLRRAATAGAGTFASACRSSPSPSPPHSRPVPSVPPLPRRARVLARTRTVTWAPVNAGLQALVGGNDGSGGDGYRRMLDDVSGCSTESLGGVAQAAAAPEHDRLGHVTRTGLSEDDDALFWTLLDRARSKEHVGV